MKQFPQSRILIAIAATLVIPFLSGCGRTASAAYPSTIRFAYGVSAEMNEDQLRRMDLLQSYLASATGMHIDIRKTVSYAPTIEAICADKADLATMGPFAYILASQKGCVEALAVRGMDDGSPAGYRSIIATHKDSGIHSIEEMKAQSHRLTLAFNDPASTSGHLVPRAGMAAMGIDPERDFKKVMFAPSHAAAALTLKAEKVDIACMMESTLPRLYEKGKMSKGDVRILWTSKLMPNSPVVIRKGLAPEVKKRLLDAFLQMNTKDPKLFALMKQVSLGSGTRYVAAKDSWYDGLRDMARRIPDMQLLDK